jgi:hypothetical protein
MFDAADDGNGIDVGCNLSGHRTDDAGNIIENLCLKCRKDLIEIRRRNTGYDDFICLVRVVYRA